ncbi:MAG TPA: sigma 54-interacting transcriptional regulator [Vicinamibacterales bacterium]|nr:sigma 54-interacting transcriptional regulator [Vicinamibacterales bacterium]
MRAPVGGAVMSGVLELMGPSPATEQARRAMTEAVGGMNPLMISAETGLDPVAVARAIHNASERAGGAFVPVDCASADALRLDQQLFGPNPADGGELEYVSEGSLLAGAFGGTLLIANVSELPSHLQSRLARILRERRIYTEARGSVALDVRIMATVRGNVEEDFRDGRLRRELRSRFVLTLEVPALRHRPSDIPMLIGCLVADAAAAAGVDVPAFSREALSLLSALPWRRNLDELGEVLDLFVGAAAGGTIQLDDVLRHVAIERVTPRQAVSATLRDARSTFEREYIAAVLSRYGWRMDEAARNLGIQRTNLYRKVRQLGIARARAK